MLFLLLEKVVLIRTALIPFTVQGTEVRSGYSSNTDTLIVRFSSGLMIFVKFKSVSEIYFTNFIKINQSIIERYHELLF